MTSALEVSRMSYGAAIVGIMTYGIYLCLTFICFHFLWINYKGSSTSHQILTIYTIAMFCTTTIYFLAATIWSEQEFVESAVNPAIFATLTSGRLASTKNVTAVVNIWLADSLILYRVFIVWGQNVLIMIFPSFVYLASVGVGIALCYATTRPDTAFGATGVTTFGTAFWSLTVSLNVIATLLIAGRLLYHQHKIRILKQSSQYTGVTAILVESAALYSISGLIYIPLFARNLALQFPFAALFCSASSIAPNLIVLRMALGRAVTTTSNYTVSIATNSHSRRANIAFASNSNQYTNSSVTASAPSGIKSFKDISTSHLGEDEVYSMAVLDNSKLSTDGRVV